MFQILEESRQFSSGVRVGFLKNGGPEPHLVVTFDSYICKQLDWQNNCHLRLQIGANEHQGLLRITVSSEPSTAKLSMHTEGARVDFGAIPALSRETRHPRTTKSTVYFNGPNEIQVKIPTWEETLPSFSKLKKATAPQHVHGPKVIFHPYPVLIHNGTEMPLYEFQAVLLEPLTHKIGGVFPANLIIEKGYQALGCAPHPAVSYLLPTEMVTLGRKLKSLRLDLKHVKGMGYSLNVMEETQ